MKENVSGCFFLNTVCPTGFKLLKLPFKVTLETK